MQINIPSSIILDNITDTTSAQDSPVTYFYFDHQDRSTQGPLQVLSSLLGQLLEALPGMPQSVTERYEKDTSKEFPLHETEKLLTEVVGMFGCVYLIIDALDECETTNRGRFLEPVTRLTKAGNVRLLVTSRPHIQDVNDRFEGQPSLRIEAQADDVRKYLYQELDHGGIRDIADDSFIDRLVQRLTEGAGGM
ncbi:hypothetical protein QBC46DRAFT_1825 [Diplogelasinospora grovesii]|uniref:Nephrocystin 3-like N-terminal domain-containing protein n=1 Tax=Diplogelasinospora grovesii TaxID=303347 RepID=A0AAN6NHZ9_9PEZI|nr:hypothetical protein QBC46DRAFT_1825 [Diplogelasinospora grovesii]